MRSLWYSAIRLAYSWLVWASNKLRSACSSSLKANTSALGALNISINLDIITFPFGYGVQQCITAF